MLEAQRRPAESLISGCLHRLSRISLTTLTTTTSRRTYMPFFNNLPIMPKEVRAPMSRSVTAGAAPYPQPAASAQRSAAIWSTADDEILLRARASGLNWQPIAARHFPNKTANACRKRHERLIERRHVEEWDHQKLELLAEEYLACRKEMWEVLANRLGERWQVVEAKVRVLPRETIQHSD